MNLREMAEAAGFWGWTVWPEELKEFARLVTQEALMNPKTNLEVIVGIDLDTSLADEPKDISPKPAANGDHL